MIKIKPELCTGCRTCELLCSARHGADGFNPALARVYVKAEGIERERPVICRLCRRPQCLEACAQGALAQDAATRVVTVDPDRCTRCGACAAACPFGAVRLHPDSGLPLFCDLCGGQPACAAHCPFEVLAFDAKGGEADA